MDNDFDIVCPACGKKMIKVYMENLQFCIDVCIDGCGGLYFDNREFSKVDEDNENIDDLLLALRGKIFKKVDTTQKRNCPCCGASMVKNYSSINKTIEVDECYSCGGKFLDYDELNKIRAEYDNDEQRSAALMKEVDKIIGKDLEKLKEEVEKYKAGRSFLKKFFDEYICR